MATRKPWPSDTKWALVVNPPRERPSAWSGGSCICASLRPPNRHELLPLFPPSGGRPTGTDNSAVDTPEVVVDPLLVIPFVQQRGDDPDPGAVLPPPVEALEDRLPGAVAFREVAPRGAGMEDPEDAVDDRTRLIKRVARRAVMSPVRQEGRDPVPLLIGEFIAAHGRTRWGNGPIGRPGLPIIIFLRTMAEQRSVYS